MPDTLNLLRSTFGLYNLSIGTLPIGNLEQARSALGSIIQMPIRFQGGHYKKRNQYGTIVYIPYDAYDLPHSSIVETTQENNIVETPLLAGQIVEEFISNGRYEINIKGLIVNNNSTVEPPFEELEKFGKFSDLAGVKIAIESNWLNLLGVCEVTIARKSINQLEGYSHVFAYTLDLRSTQSIDLRLREGV
jgi:Domain of unknown function (DUF6046)